MSMETQDIIKRSATNAITPPPQARDYKAEVAKLIDVSSCVGCTDLLRLMLTLDSQLYPQISGHKSRFAIRFMPLDSENGLVPERL
ncbi:cell division protein ZapD, partial [Salmonella enterica subsp. enterica serovar Kentucky]|nr:cell division protein ZapD [Salmonella enterica subsp. enterica serovar Kentucky]